MKQHIGINQLNELSEKGKERLRKWWMQNRRKGDRVLENGTPYFIGEFLGDDPYYVHGNSKCVLPLLSIGQMIEFLDITSRKINISWGLTPTKIGAKALGWRVQRKNFDQTHGELCDALWETVKEILNKS